MVAAKFLLVAMAACIKASPVATAAYAATTDWTALAIPENTIDWDGIDMDAFKNPANWKQEFSADEIDKISSNPVNDTISTRSGPCSQGNCPDYNAPFDLVYQFVAVPVQGDPPLTIFESSSIIRVNDCGQCLYHKVGSGLGAFVPGGCYDFTSCGRQQTICVDPGNTRAHRIWKDKNVKTCYGMKVETLGSCGPIKSRIVLHPKGTTACNW
ncbi:hypothetical protein V491_00848 [Pseudogymnoascus sp. VKM F-3775]|nr:hypothetical protein V491_00848 [Pseudogymnoascus sp. VKM F-3775]